MVLDTLNLGCNGLMEIGLSVRANVMRHDRRLQKWDETA